jgi:tetratricopeptide (TPR) repeat protein
LLFDLKGKRKRLVQVTYVMLAILFGGGLVLFGVGGNVSGGLIDAFRGNSGGSADTSAFTDAVDRAKVRAQRNPDNPAVWLALVRAQFNLASSPAGSDAETGQLTDRGQQAVIEVTQAWDRYEKLKPKKIDPSGASFAALAFGALQDYDKAADIQEASLESRPSPNGYFQLADFAYRADQVERGDAAAKEAVRRTPSDQRNTVRALIKDLKKQGKQVAAAVKEAKKAQREARKKGQESPDTNFGPLPGQGTGQTSTP